MPGPGLRTCLCKLEWSAGDGASTPALKPMGRFNQCQKQRLQVAPQNGDLSPQKLKTGRHFTKAK